jgi:hypothetical protein
MTTTFATPHFRDLREVLSDTLKQTQEAIRRTRELLHHSDHLLDPDREPEPAGESNQVVG